MARLKTSSVPRNSAALTAIVRRSSFTASVRQFGTRETRKSFAVLRARFLHDLPRQMRRGRGFVPVEGLQIIAHKLLIETRWADADAIFIRRPDTRRIRSETVVDQQQVIA